MGERVGQGLQLVGVDSPVPGTAVRLKAVQRPQESGERAQPAGSIKGVVLDVEVRQLESPRVGGRQRT